jgi:hypothetical protein
MEMLLVMQRSQVFLSWKTTLLISVDSKMESKYLQINQTTHCSSQFIIKVSVPRFMLQEVTNFLGATIEHILNWEKPAKRLKRSSLYLLWILNKMTNQKIYSQRRWFCSALV